MAQVRLAGLLSHLHTTIAILITMAQIEAVSKVNKNTIVIIHTIGPVLMSPWIDFANVTAVILAGLPGEQTGPSLMNILYGDSK